MESSDQIDPTEQTQFLTYVSLEKIKQWRVASLSLRSKSTSLTSWSVRAAP